jgi:hypothetical protein
MENRAKKLPKLSQPSKAEGRLRRKFGIYSGDSGLIRPLMTNQCALLPRAHCTLSHGG